MRKIFLTSSITYAVFSFLGIYLEASKPDNPFQKHHFLYLPSDSEQLFFLFSLGLLAAGVILVCSHIFETLSSSYRSLRSELLSVLGPLPLPFLLYLAFISAIGEELLFRAGLQAHIGIFFSSLLFGLLHLGPGLRIGAWSLWAFFSGLMMSWVFGETNNLWPALIAHALVNSVGMVRLRRYYLSQVTPE